MDTDDIAVEDRFEQQFELMEKENLDLLGGHIAEFIDQPDEIVSYRRVPTKHEDIITYQRMRSAFNHMTVMFKKKWFSRLVTTRMAFIWKMIFSGSI